MGLEGADSKIAASAAPSRLSSAALSSDPMAASWRMASAAVAAARLSSASQCSVANGSAEVGEGQTRGSPIEVIDTCAAVPAPYPRIATRPLLKVS